MKKPGRKARVPRGLNVGIRFTRSGKPYVSYVHSLRKWSENTDTWVDATARYAKPFVLDAFLDL